jgi:hypothetical protein
MEHPPWLANKSGIARRAIRNLEKAGHIICLNLFIV